MNSKPEVSIIGTGRLGTALAIALASEGYPIGSLVARRRESARRAASYLDVSTRVSALKELADSTGPGLLLISTPDDQIPAVAEMLAHLNWQTVGTRTALHTSGALSSEQLAPLAGLWLLGLVARRRRQKQC